MRTVIAALPYQRLHSIVSRRIGTLQAASCEPPKSLLGALRSSFDGSEGCPIARIQTTRRTQGRPRTSPAHGTLRAADHRSPCSPGWQPSADQYRQSLGGVAALAPAQLAAPNPATVRHCAEYLAPALSHRMPRRIGPIAATKASAMFIGNASLPADNDPIGIGEALTSRQATRFRCRTIWNLLNTLLCTLLGCRPVPPKGLFDQLF